MRNRLVLAVSGAVLGVATIGGAVMATPGSGVISTQFAVGRFNEIDAQTLSSSWQARIDTKGVTDVYMLENRIAPGGTFGWHSHPGPSLVTIKSGALTCMTGTIPNARPQSLRQGRVSSMMAAISMSCATKAPSRRWFTLCRWCQQAPHGALTSQAPATARFDRLLSDRGRSAATRDSRLLPTALGRRTVTVRRPFMSRVLLDTPSPEWRRRPGTDRLSTSDLRRRAAKDYPAGSLRAAMSFGRLSRLAALFARSASRQIRSSGFVSNVGRSGIAYLVDSSRCCDEGAITHCVLRETEMRTTNHV